MRLVKALHLPACDGRRPHGLHRGRAPRARLVRVRRPDGRGRPAARARGQAHRPASAGAMPQDVKLSPDGRTFYVADMASNGVWLIDAHTHAQGSASSPPAAAPTACTPAATRRMLYVSNRGEGTITLISFRTRRPVRTWRIPGGGSPGHGRRLGRRHASCGCQGRYNGEVYAISTAHRAACCTASTSAAARTACASGPSPGATRSGTRASCASYAGRRTWNSAPDPAAGEVSVTSPPAARARRRASGRPSPAPPWPLTPATRPGSKTCRGHRPRRRGRRRPR